MAIYGADEAVLSFRTKSTSASHKGMRPAKRKATVCLKEKENVYESSSSDPDSPVVQRKKHTRFGTFTKCWGFDNNNVVAILSTFRMVVVIITQR